jgi:hypothetical protein
MRLRAAAWLLVIAGVAVAAPASSQSQRVGAAPEGENVVPVNGRLNGNGNGGKNGEAAQPAYQDQLIDDGRLEPDIWLGEVQERDAGGWPRGWRIDGIYSNQSRAGFSQTDYGVGFSGFLATPLYGSWTLDGVVSNSQDASVATLWQRDMPFEGGWRTTNGAINVNSPSIDLARTQARWILPSSPMLGGLTEWRNVDGTQLTAGIGEPGVFTGLYVPGFRRLDGYLGLGGGQTNLSRNWTAGVQYYGARDVTAAWQLFGDDRTFSTSSWFGATAWQEAMNRFQLNFINTDNSFDGNHQGVWADAYIQDGRYGHGFGAFHLGSNLAWGNQPIGSELRGVYYRINYASRQWLWDANVDYTAPLADNPMQTTTFVSGSVRHQLWQDLGLGAGGNSRFDGQTAWSAFAYVENVWPALINRTQVYTARNDPKREYMVTLMQTWNTPAGTRLSTSLMGGRYDDRSFSSNQYGLGLIGGGDITNELSLDANVQWLRSTGDAQPTTLLGNVGFSWRFARDFTLLGTFYRSQTRSDLPLQILSPIDQITQISQERINDRGGVLILRYETRAGSMAAPLGGAPGGGAGRVSGFVYLDGNEDGRLGAGEQGAANLTVVLNGRWSVRTDAQGRFEFPSVVAGHHTITVLPDNLPLPWLLANDGRAEFNVPVRGSVTVDIPAQRMR